MVHHNPGEQPTESKFLQPAFLKENGYDAKVFFLFDAAQFGIDWQSFDKDVFPDTSAGAKWVKTKSAEIKAKYNEAKANGLKVYCMLDMLVLPKALVSKYENQVLNNKGKIDISKPFTQKCFRYLMNQMFDVFPKLDGLVICTGETYLQDAPFYIGNHPVQNGMQDHVTLINLLRDEVCVKRNKDLIYRTWDISKFHSLPKYYLSITDSIKPHEHLYFSIKHTIVDFWRAPPKASTIDYTKFNEYWINEASSNGVTFNPNLGIGKHKQIVEVQCQREYEGKGAHPDYIARGVIEGFDELKTANSKKPYCLAQLKDNPNFSGVWTWSRGGGWGGPYITNEFWCELNAYGMAEWTKHTNKSEEQICKEFALKKGLPAKEFSTFRQLCLLSTKGVMLGQYSMFGDVTVVWTRDNFFGGLYLLAGSFDKMIKNGSTTAYLNEKKEAVKVWGQIEALSKQLHFKDTALNSFIQTSCTYGRMKYAIIEKGWNIMLLSKQVSFDRNELAKLVSEYDSLWQEWKGYAAQHHECPTIYKDADEGWSMTKSINEIRKKVGA